MQNHAYKIIEVAGASSKSIEDAIETIITRASETIKNMGWFEIVETRGQIENGKVSQYQVVLKIGFMLE